MKSMKITPPEGYEVDKDKSTFEEIVFKPVIPNYNSICKELFKNQLYYITSNGTEGYLTNTECYECSPNNAVSLEQIRKILAINQLVNIAYYPKLNKYSTYTVNSDVHHGTIVLFRSAVDAQAVIDNSNLRTILDTVYK